MKQNISGLLKQIDKKHMSQNKTNHATFARKRLFVSFEKLTKSTTSFHQRLQENLGRHAICSSALALKFLGPQHEPTDGSTVNIYAKVDKVTPSIVYSRYYSAKMHDFLYTGLEFVFGARFRFICVVPYTSAERMREFVKKKD